MRLPLTSVPTFVFNFLLCSVCLVIHLVFLPILPLFLLHKYEDEDVPSPAKRIGLALKRTQELLVCIVKCSVALERPLSPCCLETMDRLQNAEELNFEKREECYIIRPVLSSARGVLLYPGALVPPEAYFCLAEKIAQQGITMVILRVPLNLICYGGVSGQGIIETIPGIRYWVLMGHSMGGMGMHSFLSKSTKKQQQNVLGLIYVASGNNVHWNRNFYQQHPDKRVLSISAEHDYFYFHPDEPLKKKRSYYPPDTEFICIKGGNHAQFGCYGKQEMDGFPTLDAHQQQEDTASMVTKFVDRFFTESGSTIVYNLLPTH